MGLIFSHGLMLNTVSLTMQILFFLVFLAYNESLFLTN